MYSPGTSGKLSGTQQEVIALDYGMQGGTAKIPVRKALLTYAVTQLAYAVTQLGLDSDACARTPHKQKIILINPDSVEPQFDKQKTLLGQEA